MKFIYNLAISFYAFLIRLASPFNHKARLWTKGRKGLLKKIKADMQKEKSERAWFHCSSMGEFEQARPLIEHYRKNFPAHKIILTFFSPSGYEVRKNYELADYIYYMPIDTKKNARKFVEYTTPKVTFFAKYDFWANYLSTLNEKKIHIYGFSCIFRPTQFFFHKFGGSYRKLLLLFTHIFVQNEQSLELLKSINIKNASIAGDTRFDRVFDIARNVKEIKKAEIFKDGKKLIIAGSTWQADEELFFDYIKYKSETPKIIIAPHEVHTNNIKRIENKLGDIAVKYSTAEEKQLKDAKVLIIDNIGMLSSLYQYADIAYIGGGFGIGIHNILEAATFGMPVIFGTNYCKFQEAIDMISIKAAISVNNSEQFISTVEQLINKPDKLSNLSEKAKNYVAEKRGATNKIISQLKTTKI